MRVCQFTEATTAGVFTHVSQLSEVLKDYNDIEQVFLLSSILNPELKDCSSFYGNRLIIYDIQRSKNPYYVLRRLLLLINILKREQFDILHCHSTIAGIYGRIACLFSRKTRVIYTPHSFAFNSKINVLMKVALKWLERGLSIFTDNIICVSEAEHERACKIGIAKEKLVVIKNGIKPEEKIISKDQWLIENGFPQETIVIGFIGRLTKQKNPEMFIKSAKKINLSNLCFVIVGNGPLYPRIVNLIDDSRIIHKLDAKGSQMVSVFDIYVSTSEWEAMPYTILEAMANNVPVIATKLPDVEEIVKDGITGYLVEPDDVQGLAQKLEEVLVNKDNLDNIRENAKDFVREYHSIKLMKEKIINAYERIVRLVT